MQTFLPYPGFRKSAACLDRQRLGKQRVEGLQILRALLNNAKGGWRNHPAVKMWQGHEVALAAYAQAICDEWIRRGYKDTCMDKILDLIGGRTLNLWHWDDNEDQSSRPSWLGNPNFHESHQSNLLRKDPIWYGKFNWPVPDDLPYIWPTP